MTPAELSKTIVVDVKMPIVILETTRFGEIEIEADATISLPDGIPGFPNVRNVVLIRVSEDQPFYWIQDATQGDLAFLSVIPWEYFPDYDLFLTDEDEAALEVEEASDLLVLSLVTVDRDAGVVSANLLGPVIVNQPKRLARQVVLRGDYSTRTPLGA